MNKVRKLLAVIRQQWPLELSASIFLAVAALLLFVNLRTLVGGYSADELQVESITNSFPSIIENLVYWPYYLLVWLARLVVDDAVLAARMVSAGLGFIASLHIFLIIRRWFSIELAIVGATLFVAGSWLLQIARSGTPEILGITVILTLFSCVLWLINRPSKLLPSVVVFAATLAGLFVPYLPVLMIGGFILAITKERSLLKIVPTWLWIILISLVVGVAVVVGFGFFENYSATASLFAIPSSLPSFADILANFRSTLAAIFWFAPANPGKWLGNLPLLDIFGVVMVTLGVYHHERNFGNRRSIILFGSTGILLILVSLNGGIDSVGFSLLMPLIALFVISGIQEFLGLWRDVFPRNPIAKALAVFVISILVSVSSYYQLNRYYIAWANSPETRAVYSANIE